LESICHIPLSHHTPTMEEIMSSDSEKTKKSELVSRIKSLSPAQTSQILDWYSADLQEEKNIATAFGPDDIEVILPKEAQALLVTPFEAGVALLIDVVQHDPELIEGYLADCTGVRGMAELETISKFLPLALALWFSVDFKVEYEVLEKEGGTEKRKKVIIQSRKLSAPLADFLKKFIS